jgi:hypothetical protein
MLHVTVLHAPAQHPTPTRQPEWFQGLMLLAPMLSLDKVKQRGLNPLLM